MINNFFWRQILPAATCLDSVVMRFMDEAKTTGYENRSASVHSSTCAAEAHEAVVCSHQETHDDTI